jgi:hypothetical protein
MGRAGLLRAGLQRDDVAGERIAGGASTYCFGMVCSLWLKCWDWQTASKGRYARPAMTENGTGRGLDKRRSSVCLIAISLL